MNTATIKDYNLFILQTAARNAQNALITAMCEMVRDLKEATGGNAMAVEGVKGVTGINLHNAMPFNIFPRFTINVDGGWSIKPEEASLDTLNAIARQMVIKLLHA